MTDVNARALTVSVGTTKLRCWVRGDGEPVVLVNGAGADASMWALQVPALLRAGFRVITFDYRELGPGDPPYTLDDLVVDTGGLVEHLALGASHLIGFSLGALVAQEVALARPELVRSLALIATRARTDVFRSALIDAALSRLDEPEAIPTPYAATTLALQMLSPRTLGDEPVAADWLSLFGRSVDSDALPALRAQYAAARIGDRRSALGAVTAPCLVLSFDDDVLAPPYLGREMAEAIPATSFRSLPDCGHLGLLERPGAVNEAVTSFLRLGRIPSTGPTA